MELMSGVVVGQKYALERPLARGGMGSVWLGRHLVLRSQVALKFMLNSDDATPTARARFEREARAAAKLPSPHIVQIVDYGIDDATPFLVMEYLEGEDLSTRLERLGRLSLRATAAIIGQIAKALKVAHDNGIVHRDLKPSNVFLARAGEEETVKLLDFGVAKVHRPQAGDESTASGELLGSPQYMSPEQARGGEVDARSDLWSLGVITFVALTGHRPFAGANVGDVLVKICTGEVPRATSLASDLPAEIDSFFARALCRSPDGRFSSARAFADELSAVAERRANGPRSGALAPRSDDTLTLDGPQVISARAVAPRSPWLRWQTWGTVAVAALGTVIAWRAWPSPRSAGEPLPIVAATTASASPLASASAPAASASASAASASASAASASASAASASAPAASASASAPAMASADDSTTAPVQAAAPAQAPRRPATVRRPRAATSPATEPKAAPVDPKFGLPTSGTP